MNLLSRASAEQQARCNTEASELLHAVHTPLSVARAGCVDYAADKLDKRGPIDDLHAPLCHSDNFDAGTLIKGIRMIRWSSLVLINVEVKIEQ